MKIVKKSDYNTKTSEIENKSTDHDHSDKYVTTPECNKLTSKHFAARLKHAKIASKSDVAKFVTKIDFNNKLKDVTSKKGLTKDLINKFSILNGAKYFSSRIFQNYLVFMPTKKYINYFSGTTRIESWKSNGMSKENIESIIKLDSNFAPTFEDHHSLPDMNFNGHYLIKNGISIPKKVINLYISYTLVPQLTNLNTYFTLSNCLFGPVKLTNNGDLDKYKYTGYGIVFDSRSEFLFTDVSYGKNVILFGADMSSSVHVDNKGKDILIFGEGPTQGLDDRTLTTEAKYPINFTKSGKRFVSSLHYNGSNSFLFVNATKVYQ